MSISKQNIDISQLEIKPIDFEAFSSQYAFRKNNYKLTKKNPFKTMSDADWEIYVSTRTPHFTSEPYYELIPWTELQQLEVDAKKAGWELILRTTNNTAYCPGHVGQFWCQRTQWIFGLPNMQFLIHLTYNEDKWSLIDDKNTNELPVKNYFSLQVISTTKLIVREKTQVELDEEIDNAIDLDIADELDYSLEFALKQRHNKDIKYDYKSKYSFSFKPTLRYYSSLTPASGWISHNGMSCRGNSQFDYIFVGSNAKLESYGYYTSPEDEDKTKQNDKQNNNLVNKKENKENNLMAKMLSSTFWIEWIENNKDKIAPGVFDKVQITHWSDTYVLPGGQFYVDEVLKWNMDYQFLKQLMQTSIRNWTKSIFGYDCCGAIGNSYWNFKYVGSLMHNPELFKKTCILEAKKADSSASSSASASASASANASSSASDEWVPLDGYCDSLLQYKDIRLSHNAQTLIKQVWDFVEKQNQ